MTASYFFLRWVRPDLTAVRWVGTVVVLTLYFFSVTCATLAAMALVPADFGWATWTWMFGLGAFVLGISSRPGLWLLEIPGVARDAGEEWNRPTQEMAKQMGVRLNRVLLLRMGDPAAFALPLAHTIAFSERLTEICAPEEVKAICAHELAHLSESRATIAVRVLGALGWMSFVLIKPVAFRFGSVALILPVCFVLLTIWRVRVAKRMEVRADRIATQQSRGTVYAVALEKLYRDAGAPAVRARKGSHVHPELYDRLVAAGLTPDYPRPRPARRYGWIGILLLLSFGILFGLWEFRWVERTQGRPEDRVESEQAGLFVPKRLDRIEVCRFVSGVGAENNADQ
jgi:Zn-dependent protease with chaperone function